jgi:hypothetical protein
MNCDIKIKDEVGRVLETCLDVAHTDVEAVVSLMVRREMEKIHLWDEGSVSTIVIKPAPLTSQDRLDANQLEVNS